MIFARNNRSRFIKKYSLATAGIVSLALFVYGIASPTIAMGVTAVTIRGNVNKVIPGPSLGPVQSQQVSIVCGGVTKTATTNASGLYTITFAEPGCSSYTPASAKSTYNGSVITRQVTVSGDNRATIDLNF